mmetsp:Transcript_30502/g.47784  ORF Transcript_30502/g.47784 Transcript_30502/m.47784 type:complete len:148 (+) Transcript_30502:603-1046(+)
MALPGGEKWKRVVAVRMYFNSCKTSFTTAVQRHVKRSPFLRGERSRFTSVILAMQLGTAGHRLLVMHLCSYGLGEVVIFHPFGFVSASHMGFLEAQFSIEPGRLEAESLNKYCFNTQLPTPVFCFGNQHSANAMASEFCIDNQLLDA